MINSKPSGLFTGAGALTAIASSLCCITPVIALLAGSSSIAANLSWIEPARPYLIGLSITILAFAWYVKLNPAKVNETDCDCETSKKPTFLQSGTFLAIVSVFAILMMTFPLYATIFHPKPKVNQSASIINTQQQVKLAIQGMTCDACSVHINNALSKIAGVVGYKTSYATRSSLVTFDESKVSISLIKDAITKTGYKVEIIP